MVLLRHRPAPPLDGCVECFWWSRRDREQEFAESMLPSGQAQLVIALHDQPLLCLPGSPTVPSLSWTGAVVHGPQSSFYRAGPKPRGAVVGVSFRPGMAGAVLGVPAAALTDRHVGLDDLWGRTASREWQHALRGAPSPAAVFALLERTLGARLLSHAARPLLIHPAVAHALAGRPAARVRDVQQHSGYSPRHFAALFREAVGLTPKHYYRIRRFNAAVRTLAAAPPTAPVADVAAAVGYADQAHLIREFREFAGVTPGRYRPSSPDSPLHHRG
jgi:AraC-like DNA-binding protein